MSSRALVVFAIIALAVASVEATINDEDHCKDGLLALSNRTSHGPLQIPSAAVSDCGQHRPEASRSWHRIAGGYKAKLGEYPSFVKILSIYEGSRFQCGGTIISKRLVLTAAHCLKDGGPRLVTVEVRAGSVKRKFGTKLYARKFCLPKEYVNYRESYLDIALLVMEQPFEFNEFVQPACLPEMDIDPSAQAHVVGFGMTQSNSSKKADRLQVLPVTKSLRCPFHHLGSLSVCFITNDPNYAGTVCKGDSGGPVYSIIDGRQTVVGVVSGGTTACDNRDSSPAIFMDVFKSNSRLKEIANECQRL